MRLIVGLVLITNLMDAARGSALMPLCSDDRLCGAAALGVLVTVPGGCALLGNVAFGFVAHRVPRRVTLAVCFVLVGGPSSAAFALGAPLPVLVAVTALAGLAAPFRYFPGNDGWAGSRMPDSRLRSRGPIVPGLRASSIARQQNWRLLRRRLKWNYY
jgi:hypothetical protein